MKIIYHYANQDFKNSWIDELMPKGYKLDDKFSNSLLPVFRANILEKRCKIYEPSAIFKENT